MVRRSRRLSETNPAAYDDIGTHFSAGVRRRGGVV